MTSYFDFQLRRFLLFHITVRLSARLLGGLSGGDWVELNIEQYSQLLFFFLSLFNFIFFFELHLLKNYVFIFTMDTSVPKLKFQPKTICVSWCHLDGSTQITHWRQVSKKLHHYKRYSFNHTLIRICRIEVSKTNFPEYW